VDILDNGSLKLQYNRNRYYDQYTGRWLTHDPLGYIGGMNLYEYALRNPASDADMLGLLTRGQAQRVIEQYLNSIEYIRDEARVDPTPENCIHYYLVWLRNEGKLVDLKRLAISIGFLPVNAIVSGTLTKIGVGVLEEIIKAIAEGADEDTIFEILKTALPDDTPTKIIKELAAELAKTKIGKTFGPGRSVVRKSRERTREVTCYFYVAAETREGRFGIEYYEEGHKFSLFASCIYENRTEHPCCCKGAFAVIAHGEHGSRRYTAKHVEEKILYYKRGSR